MIFLILVCVLAGGVDFTPGDKYLSVIIPVGHTIVPVNVTMLLDNICEGVETFNLSFIEESLPYGFRLEGSRSAAVIILDQPSNVH